MICGRVSSDFIQVGLGIEFTSKQLKSDLGWVQYPIQVAQISSHGHLGRVCVCVGVGVAGVRFHCILLIFHSKVFLTKSRHFVHTSYLNLTKVIETMTPQTRLLGT